MASQCSASASNPSLPVVQRRALKSLQLSLTPLPSLDRTSQKVSATSLQNSSPRAPATVRDEFDTLYPDWLESRKDFQELRNRYDKLAAIDVSQVCRKPATLRNDFERRAAVRFIKQCPFFKSMKTDQLLSLTDKMQSFFFSTGDVLMRKGEVADCLYTIYRGKVRIYVEENAFIEEVVPGNVIGESAIQMRGVRSATVVAQEDVAALRLNYQDFDTIAYKMKQQDFTAAAEFLSKLHYFSTWHPGKRYRLASIMIVKQYEKDQVVFRRGDTPRDLYIVREGLIRLTIDIDLERTNRWPTGLKQWLSVSTTKRYAKTLLECHSGDFFGEQELIDSVPLRATAQCVSPLALLLIVRQEFFAEIFSDKDKKLLSQTAASRPLTNELRFQVEFQNLQAKLQTDALLNAINTNCVPKGRGLFQSQRDLRRGELARRVVQRHRESERSNVILATKKTQQSTEPCITLKC